jgi:hypothetical protein
VSIDFALRDETVRRFEYRRSAIETLVMDPAVTVVAWIAKVAPSAFEIFVECRKRTIMPMVERQIAN